MDEAPVRQRRILVVAKQPDRVDHRRIAELLDGDAGGDPVWKGAFGVIAASGLDHQPDRISGMRVEQPLLDQPAVDRCVEQRVVGDVVHVAVNVIVRPAGLQRAE